MTLPRYDRLRTPCALRLRFKKPWNYRALGLERVGKRRQRRIDREARGYPNPVHRARVFERALAGGRRTYKDVAAEFGMTRAAVCQYVAIVRRLPEDVVDAIAAEGEPSRLRLLSMKRLVGIARLGTDEARRGALVALMSGRAQTPEERA